MIAALEATANGIVITDRDGAIRWVNPAYTSLTGYTAEEAIGQNPRILKSGQHDQAFYRDLWETILSGRVWAKEIINRRKDGSLYTEAQTITPVRDERGQISHFIAIKQDITERKRAEMAIRELNLALEQGVQQRTRELALANQLLEAASRHKSEFLAHMAHELRTPLNSILGFSGVLLDQGFDVLTEKQARFVQHIQVSGQHLLALIDDLVDLSKVEAGVIELRPEPFELPEAIHAALAAIQPQADLKDLDLELHVDGVLSTLTADPVRFKQILLNLLSNAVKFTPEGGRITITARRDPYSDDFVEVLVADTGIGIKPDDLSSLFQEFVRLDAAMTRRISGTGLGLALTKKLVELHRGTISAVSKGEGRGSTFAVRLPIALSRRP
jgi:PAS domain S-box-containing protein